MINFPFAIAIYCLLKSWSYVSTNIGLLSYLQVNAKKISSFPLKLSKFKSKHN